MAFSVAAVSMSVSPFFTEEDATDMFITSAPRRLPAISKEDWVRVDGLEEEVDLGAAAQGAFFFSICRLTSTAPRRAIEQRLDVQRPTALDPEKVPMGESRRSPWSGLRPGRKNQAASGVSAAALSGWRRASPLGPRWADLTCPRSSTTYRAPRPSPADGRNLS
jgi:hypothetical protein